MHPDVAEFLARAHAMEQADDMDRPHVLIAIDPESPMYPSCATGPVVGAMAALERADEWARELNAAGLGLGPADPPFVVVAVPLFPDPGPRPA